MDDLRPSGIMGCLYYLRPDGKIENSPLYTLPVLGLGDDNNYVNDLPKNKSCTFLRNNATYLQCDGTWSKLSEVILNKDKLELQISGKSLYIGPAHPPRAIPKLVKQHYGTELRSRTLASIKPEISQALSSLLDEIRAVDDTKVLRAGATPYTRQTYKPVARTPIRPNRRPLKSCPLCKQAGRKSHNHFLSECNFLPERDRKYKLELDSSHL
ncbi:hypothetical protein QZH41_005271 [Actinostola sp. cb2023]|nr:hypothetical protein QZH41_005271 [Actinostola sp. cb2023]